MSQHKKLPIGIQTLADIIQGGYYYVDKTSWAHRLTEQGKYFFISRPRRFGKSLFIDTLKELFEGNEPLFQGLYIHDKWDWNKKHPVIRMSFGDGVMRNREELDARIRYTLRLQREYLGVPDRQAVDIAGEFADLIRLAHQRHGERVGVLIDEYDKPILDNITHGEAAAELRDGLKNLYSVLKDADPHLRFCLLTGVSKFSKVSLFSGLNNLEDITMVPDYSAICGYTEADLDRVFAPELEGLDRDQIRHWYNGYNWLGEAVYNPFDLLLLLRRRQFLPYWFESATPTFLVKLLSERGVFTPQLAQWQTSARLLNQFDVNAIATEALLFQTGYLTIQKAEQPVLGRWRYTLDYPNREVETSLNEALVPALGLPAHAAERNRNQILDALLAGDTHTFEQDFSALFASIPHDWYRNNPIARYEGYYASVFYSHLAAMGLDLIVEDASNTGQVDLTLKVSQHYYLFEFKVLEKTVEGSALAQLKAKRYADKYQKAGNTVTLVGVEFSHAQRQIVRVEQEMLA